MDSTSSAICQTEEGSRQGRPAFDAHKENQPAGDGPAAQPARLPTAPPPPHLDAPVGQHKVPHAGV